MTSSGWREVLVDVNDQGPPTTTADDSKGGGVSGGGSDGAVHPFKFVLAEKETGEDKLGGWRL